VRRASWCARSVAWPTCHCSRTTPCRFVPCSSCQRPEAGRRSGSAFSRPIPAYSYAGPCGRCNRTSRRQCYVHDESKRCCEAEAPGADPDPRRLDRTASLQKNATRPSCCPSATAIRVRARIGGIGRRPVRRWPSSTCSCSRQSSTERGRRRRLAQERHARHAHADAARESPATSPRRSAPRTHARA
jgi:hypothetical protein